MGENGKKVKGKKEKKGRRMAHPSSTPPPPLGASPTNEADESGTPRRIDKTNYCSLAWTEWDGHLHTHAHAHAYARM